eukprot:1159406-Pelagomonas_calceolata.AAC.18
MPAWLHRGACAPTNINAEGRWLKTKAQHSLPARISSTEEPTQMTMVEHSQLSIVTGQRFAATLKAKRLCVPLTVSCARPSGLPGSLTSCRPAPAKAWHYCHCCACGSVHSYIIQVYMKACMQSTNGVPLGTQPCSSRGISRPWSCHR